MVKRADRIYGARLFMKMVPGLASREKNLNGTNEKPLGCRRNYHILLTDGQWNGQYYGPIQYILRS